MQPPRRREPGHAAAHDHQRDLDRLRGLAERTVVAQLVAEQVRLVDERACNGSPAFGREADQRGPEKLAA